MAVAASDSGGTSVSYSATDKFTPCFTCDVCGFPFQLTPTSILAMGVQKTCDFNGLVTFTFPVHTNTSMPSVACSKSGLQFQVCLAVHKDATGLYMITSDKAIPANWWLIVPVGAS